MTTKASVLVVDDELRVRQDLSRFLTSRGYKVECLDSGAAVIPRLNASERPSLVLLDLMMPQVCGLDILAEMLKLERPVPTIVVSAVGQVSTVVQAIRMGARDYVMKPFEDTALDQAIRTVLDQTLPHGSSDADLIWSTEKLRKIRDVAVQIADTNLPVLILGESGVGKDVAARFIHSRSVRRNEPFVSVNCAALPGELLESEFFGYNTGAFTGALRDKPGKFELAGRGTLVLDEIGEMSAHLQAKLLHVLQDGQYTRLGGGVRSLQLRARILALTNRNLESAVASGEFRRDLYFRLNVIRIELPPLRDRKEDIPKLCHLFVEKYSKEYNRRPPELFPELLEAFSRYSWPGNIRQLENLIRRYVVIPEPAALLAEVTEHEVRPQVGSHTHSSLKDASAEAAETAEKDLVFRTLNDVQWNRKLAAKQLNICYKSLLNKLKRWESRDGNIYRNKRQWRPGETEG